MIVDNADLDKLITWRNRYKQLKARKKRDRQRVNTNSMPSKKMVGLVCVVRWKKIK